MKKQTKLGLVLAAAAVLCLSVASLVSAKGWVQNGADWYYVNNDGDYVTDTIQTSGNSKFYLGEDGTMQKDYFLEKDGKYYYFGSNGAMVTNTWVAIDSSIPSETLDGYKPDNYWYYFQQNGKAMKGADGKVKKTTIDGKTYAFNQYGQMCTGWIKCDGTVVDPDGDEDNVFPEAKYYGGGDNDGVLRSGWVTYYDGYNNATSDTYQEDKVNIYFYFDNKNEKVFDKIKKINNKYYAFDSEGLMLTGWDGANGAVVSGKAVDKMYFSGADDGHQVKKGWVYAVPASSVDGGAYDDDEEKYMYFGSDGKITKDQFKKVNGKFYAFSATGIMKTGLVLWATNPLTTLDYNHFVATIDLDYADGSDFAKKGYLITDDCKYYVINPYGEVLQDQTGDTSSKVSTNTAKLNTATDMTKLAIHNHGEDGARKTGANTVAFNDDNYTFNSSSAGNKSSGLSNKKYYMMGIQLKASSDVKYGLYNASFSQTNADGCAFATQKSGSKNYYTNIKDGTYIVLTTSGSKEKGANSAKKDANGNYWYIGKTTGFQGIWTCDIKWANTSFTSYEISNNAATALLNNTTIWQPALASNYNNIGVASCSTANLCSVAHLGDATVLPATTWHLVKSGDNWKVKTHGSIATMWYKGDLGNGDVWIPFGFYDSMGQTCRLLPAGATSNAGMGDYWFEPDNDYFVNCYWDN